MEYLISNLVVAAESELYQVGARWSYTIYGKLIKHDLQI